MAKPKKTKNDEQRGADNSNNSEAVVNHQKLCLSIDMDNRRIHGFTELKIVVPDNGIVGLHADNLVIEGVTVDGEPAEFEVFPHYQQLDSKDRWCVVSTATSAADASGSVYLSSLENELLPNVLIMCSKSTKPEIGQGYTQMDNGEHSPADTSRLCDAKSVKLIHIDYWVEKAETGIHFNNNVLHTDNQLRRARCWFPCMDDNLQCCCYDLEFTVADNLVAVSSGTLLHQVLTKDGPPRKTYVYRVDVPVAAQWISLAVAPFEILHDLHSTLLSYMCLSANLSKLRNTVAFFYNAFSHYEDYLSASFPFGSYTQVFITPEMAVSSCSLGASISVFSSHVLFDEKLIDQTLETRIRLADSLARQWFGVYITPEASTDEWLLDGLAGFLTDSFIKRFLGNNEARYRRYKANCAVCQADDSGATALNSTLATKDLYGTQSIGFYGKIRSWKSVAVLQMLEKQMGPESFRKILQSIVSRARDGYRSFRTLSTKEFRHFANKIGNLERPFLKEFFPRWVGSCGCPVLKMGFSYNKRKNMVELAALRGCTSRPDSWKDVDNFNPDSENREGGIGWPGMMSIRVHELDGMYDHPILPMTGEPWQLLEIQCHSKLAAKRVQKTKKGSKADGSDDNGDTMAPSDVRLNSDSPLLWLKADPEMEYLADVHFNQPVQMWINQLEKDKDVTAQAQAIAVLETLPQLPFSVVNALSNFLSDSKGFWRVRIQAAYALANTSSEDTDWAGLLHLINFYKSRRFDPNIGLPRPNDFHDFQEYFVLEAIPHAIAMVRSLDKKSPRESVEFILQLLKYNDNNGNTYSDVFWLAALVRSVGELEFGQQSIIHLPSLLKRLDRLLQFDRLMPSHNGILTINCIRSLTRIAVKLSEFIPLDRVIEFIKPYWASKTWQIQVDAGRALLELEFQCHGIDAALMLFIRYVNDEKSLRGQVKLGVSALRLCQMISQADCDKDVKSETLVAFLRLLESPVAFNNIILRHYIFCILQVLAGRAPTLYGVPRDETLRMGHTKTSNELKSIFAALIKQSIPTEPSSGHPHVSLDLEGRRETDSENHKTPKAVVASPEPGGSVTLGAQMLTNAPSDGLEQSNSLLLLPKDNLITIPDVPVLPEGQEPSEPVGCFLDDNFIDAEASMKANAPFNLKKDKEPVLDPVPDSLIPGEATKEVDTISNSHEPKKPKLIIRVKQSAASSRAEDPRNVRTIKSQDGHNDADRGASSSVSVDAPPRNFAETISTSNQNFEDANSCHDVGSRVTASTDSAKPTIDGEDLVRELQCTADSSIVILQVQPDDNLPSSTGKTGTDLRTGEHTSVSPFCISRHDADQSVAGTTLHVSTEDKEKKKKKKSKRKRDGRSDDPEHLEHRRQKKEKKRREKEMAKLLALKSQLTPVELPSREKKVADVNREDEPNLPELEVKEQLTETRQEAADGAGAASSAGTKYMAVQAKPAEPNDIVLPSSNSVSTPQISTSRKIKIKLKNRTLGKP